MGRIYSAGQLKSLAGQIWPTGRYQSHIQLESVFDDKAASCATIFNWFAEFRRGRSSLSDEDRPGRPATAVTHENLTMVKLIIMRERHISYEGIMEELQIGCNAVTTILHNYLWIRNVTARGLLFLLS